MVGRTHVEEYGSCVGCPGYFGWLFLFRVPLSSRLPIDVLDQQH